MEDQGTPWLIQAWRNSSFNIDGNLPGELSLSADRNTHSPLSRSQMSFFLSTADPQALVPSLLSRRDFWTNLILAERTLTFYKLSCPTVIIRSLVPCFPLTVDTQTNPSCDHAASRYSRENWVKKVHLCSTYRYAWQLALLAFTVPDSGPIESFVPEPQSLTYTWIWICSQHKLFADRGFRTQSGATNMITHLPQQTFY